MVLQSIDLFFETVIQRLDLVIIAGMAQLFTKGTLEVDVRGQLLKQSLIFTDLSLVSYYFVVFL